MDYTRLRRESTLLSLISPIIREITLEYIPIYGIVSVLEADLSKDGSLLILHFSHTDGESKTLRDLLRSHNDTVIKHLKSHLHKHKLPKIVWKKGDLHNDPFALEEFITRLQKPEST